MKGITNKKIKTRDGIFIIIAATLIILGGILLTNIDLIFGAGTGDADTLDSMDWAGDDCSGVDCNIKDYIDAKSAPCADDAAGECYITQATKSALDTDLAAGNIKNGVNIFGVAGTAGFKCRAGSNSRCWTDYCTFGTACSKRCYYGTGEAWIDLVTNDLTSEAKPMGMDCIYNGVRKDCEANLGVYIWCIRT